MCGIEIPIFVCSIIGWLHCTDTGGIQSLRWSLAIIHSKVALSIELHNPLWRKIGGVCGYCSPERTPKDGSTRQTRVLSCATWQDNNSTRRGKGGAWKKVGASDTPSGNFALVSHILGRAEQRERCKWKRKWMNRRERSKTNTRITSICFLLLFCLFLVFSILSRSYVRRSWWQNLRKQRFCDITVAHVFFHSFFFLFINQISVYIYKYFVVIIIVESTWVWRAKVPELSTPHLPPLPRTEEQIRKSCVRKWEGRKKRKKTQGQYIIFSRFFFLSKKQTNNWRGFLVDWKYTLPFFRILEGEQEDGSRSGAEMKQHCDMNETEEYPILEIISFLFFSRFFFQSEKCSIV